MKEYSVFVKDNGDMELFCGGQFVLGASNKGFAENFATVRKALEDNGELLMELRNAGVKRDGAQTYLLLTLPMPTAGGARR